MVKYTKITANIASLHPQLQQLTLIVVENCGLHVHFWDSLFTMGVGGSAFFSSHFHFLLIFEPWIGDSLELSSPSKAPEPIINIFLDSII